MRAQIKKLIAKFWSWLLWQQFISEETFASQTGVTHDNLASATEAAGKEKAWRILLNLFAEVLMRHPTHVGRFQRILQSMSERPFLLMHSAQAKCLLLQDKRQTESLNALDNLDQLEQKYGEFFNRFLAEIGFEDFLRRSNIRELFCAELFEGIGDIALPLGFSNEASHHANHMDMLFVVAIAKYRNARRIFEFGTYLGRTTCGLASIDESVLVHTLNLPPEEDTRYGPYVGQLIKKSPYQGRIQQLFCDSRKFAVGPYANNMDFIFIDADHSYEGVKNDTEKAFQMLATGGVVVWHDFASKSPGVYSYLYELSQERALFRIRNTCIVLYIDGVDALTFTPAKIEALLEEAK